MKKNVSVFDEAPGRSHIISKHAFAKANAVIGWTSKQKSLTVPNRTLTLRQIADRFANGLSTIDEKVALYDNGSVVIKNFEKLDLTERMSIVKAAEAHMQQVIHDRQVAARKKADDSLATVVQQKVDAELKLRDEAKLKEFSKS